MTASPLIRSRRIAAVAAIAVIPALTAPLGADARAQRATGVERAAGVRFLSIAGRVAQGDRVTVSIAVSPAKVLCTLSLKYADGRLQSGLSTAFASSGKARWRFRIMGDATPGRAIATAECGSAGTAHKALLVVGSIIPARIVVVKDGYSIRDQTFASSLSYGVILKNTSPNQDALNVYAVINVVGTDNRLAGTATTTLPGIPAGQQFALGGDLTFPGGVPPIGRLEIVLQIQKRQKHVLKLPTVTNVVLAPSVFEPDWLGAVEGELSNDQPRLELQNAQLSTVVFDAGGNVVGGGSGYAFASLPPNAREFFKIELGLRSIPFANAASAMVSAVGTYHAP